MDGLPIRSEPLPTGDQGVKKTLANMAMLAQVDSRRPDVRTWAVGVIRSAGVGDHNVAGQVRALFEWVRDRIYFVGDPVDTEWLQAPWNTLQFGAGDCDDRATLLAAGLRTIGVSASFEVAALDRSRPSEFSHVYVVASVPGMGRVRLDPTYRGTPMGVSPAGIATRLGMAPA